MVIFSHFLPILYFYNATSWKQLCILMLFVQSPNTKIGKLSLLSPLRFAKLKSSFYCFLFFPGLGERDS